MSLLADLGNVFHAIGHFVTGSDGSTPNAGTTFDQQQDKKQNQPTQAPQQTYQPQQPQQSSDNNNNNDPTAGNMINLSPLEKTSSGSTNNINPSFSQPNTLTKAPNQQDDNNNGTAGAPPSPPQQHASIFHDITHNPLTNVVGGVAKSLGGTAEYFGKNDIIDPARELADQATGNTKAYNQEMANQNVDLGLSQRNPDGSITGNSLKGGLEKWAGNSANALLTVAAPGVDNAAEKVTGNIIGDTAPAAVQTLAPKVASGALLGGAFNDASSVENGDIKPEDLAKSFGEGALVGGATGGALGGLGMARDAIRSNATDAADAASANIADKQPNEIAPGMKSANPDLAPETINAPQPQAEPAPIAVNEPHLPTLGDVVKDEVTNPATIAEGSTVAGTLTKEAVDEADAAKRAAQQPAQPEGPPPTVQFDEGPAVTPGTLPPDTVNANPTAAVVKTPTATPPAVTAPVVAPLNEAGSVPGAAVAEAPRPPAVQTPQVAEAAQQPLQVAEPTAPATVDTQAQTQAPTPAEQVQAAAAQEASQAPTPLIAQAADQGQRDLKNARFQQAVVDNAKDDVFKQAFSSDPIEKDGAPLSQLNDQAIAVVKGMSLPELVQRYGQDFKDGATPVANEGQYYEYLQAVRQLEQFPGDPTAATAAANALDAVNDYAYRSGRGLAATKVAYDDMPTSMKAAYLSRLVTKAGGDFGPDSPDFQALMSAADLQTKFAQSAQDAEQAVHEYSTQANQADPNFNANMKELLGREQAAQEALYGQNSNVLNILERNLPKSDLGTRVAQQARTSMLSSIGGRGFAMTSTMGNGAQWLADNTLSSLFGKVINGVTGRNAVRSSFARPTTLVKGAVNGFRGLARDTFGQPLVKSVDGAVKGVNNDEYSHDGTRYGFIGQHVTAPLRKMVQFGVGSHLAATKGIEDATLEQSARQAAQDAGVPKENMQGFVNYYKAHPPQAQAEEAKQAWLGVNNLHQNRVSDTLSKAASAIENLGGKAGDGKGAAVASFVAKQVRTVFIPFSHYMGGFVNKALTDRNMFYNIGRAATARSPQEFSDQLAHLTTNAGTAVGVGYGLAQAGVITNKDQNGKNYDGLYFHIGNRFIPVAIAGQAAMPIIMGATFHDAMHDGSKGGSWPQKAVTAAMQTGDDIMKATGVAGTFGGSTSVNELLAGNGEAAVPKIGGAMAGQHIPGITGDINAGLNYTSLDPTRESANTKVTDTNPVTGRQVTNQTATQLNKLENQIPILSQQLPRATGQQAPSELDRILHAGETSGTQMKADQLAKAQLSQDQQEYKDGVPIFKPGKNDVPKGYNFDNTLKTAEETGNYDNAIKGLNNELAALTAPGPEHNPPSKIQPVKDQITQMQVLKDNKVSPDDMTAYSKTTLSQWRAMGDSTSSSYNPARYQALWSLDQALAAKGVASGSIDKAGTSDTGKFYLSTSKSGSSSKASKAASLVKSNTIGSVSAIPNEDFTTNLKATPISAKIPQIQLTKPGSLIQAHKISVSPVK